MLRSLAQVDCRHSPGAVPVGIGYLCWVTAGCVEATNTGLKRKAGYKLRSLKVPRGAPRHSAHGSHTEFARLPMGKRVLAWEMGAAVGRGDDSATRPGPPG